MVKIQKPIPKNLGNKPKLDNPIKQKKQQQKKEKSSSTVKAKLLDESSPVKEAKVSQKPGKELVEKKKNKKELNGKEKSAKKPLIVAPPESPEQKPKGKKNKSGKEKNVVKDEVVEKPAKSAVVPEVVVKKDAPVAKVPVAEKSKKSKKEAKAAAAKEIPAPAKPAPAAKPKAESAPAKPQAVASKKKKEKAAPQIKEVAPAPVEAQPKAADKQKKKETAGAQKKEVVPAPAKPGKKQKNKKKHAAVAAAEPTPAIEKIKKVKKPKIELQGKKKAKVAFKTAKLAADAESKKDKKQVSATTFRYDPIPYDEEKFKSIVNTENIKKIAIALKATVEKEVKAKKSSIFDDYRYFLEVASFKIPSCPKRMVRLNLQHSLVDKDDAVLLVVPDLQRGAKVDYEETKHHYEDLLRQNGIEGITVMPMNQLRKEFRTFEQKRRLCASYEYFMCEGRIVSHVGSLIGIFTQKTRSIFHPVRLSDNKDIKSEIEKAMKRTAYRQIAKSSLQTIPVGTHKFSADQLAENIELVVDQLKTVFPGGLGNIRGLYLKIGLTGTSSLPLYISMGQAPEETPMVIGPREEKLLKLKREANEVLSKFAMTKEGKLVKLSKAGVEKKRKLQEMKAALKEGEDEVPAKKSKKAKKDNAEGEKKKKAKEVKEVKELELPENEEEEDDDDDTGDEDDENVAQLGQGSDDEETEDDEMANLDEEDSESGAEIVENGFVGEDDEESDDEQEVNQSGNDEGDEDDDDDDEDDDEDEESD